MIYLPNIINNTSGLTFYVGTASKAYGADSVEGQTNATIIYNMLAQLGWTKWAVAALFGNIQNESSFNPNRHESGGTGFGLVQWTPPSNLTDILDVIYPEGYDRTDGVKQVNAIIAEYQQCNYVYKDPDAVNRGVHRQWYKSDGHLYGFSLPRLSWYEWAHKDTGDGVSLDDMTKLFMVSYERPTYDPDWNHWQRRCESSAVWYEFLAGVKPPTGVKYFPVYLLKGGKVGYGH